MSKIGRAFYMSVLSFSGDEQRGSIRRPLKCKNKPKRNIIRKKSFPYSVVVETGLYCPSLTVYLDRACPGLLAAACLIYSMLKKEKNVTENKKKL